MKEYSENIIQGGYLLPQKSPQQLSERIHLIDGFDLGLAERTGSYVINEEHLTIMESGPSPSVQHVKKGLQDLGFTLDQVKYIIVTHVHLDHAGGAGLLLQECPNAKVVVHTKGARHMADPTKLIAGAKMVYGDKFDDLFDPIVPIPEDRLLVKGEGDELEIGSGCKLKFWDTPGHAKHHFSIVDPVSNGIFTGDTVGIRYEQLIKDGVNLFLPSTSPNQFDPAAMQQAIDRMLAAGFDRIYYGHYGMTTDTDEALRQVADWLVIFVEEAEAVSSEGKGAKELAGRLTERVKEHLRNENVQDDHPVYEILKLDMEVCSYGLVDYLENRK